MGRIDPWTTSRGISRIRAEHAASRRAAKRLESLVTQQHRISRQFSHQSLVSSVLLDGPAVPPSNKARRDRQEWSSRKFGNLGSGMNLQAPLLSNEEREGGGMMTP